MTAHASHARAALGAAISCEHLSHSYAGQPVLADVSFAASAGELLAIVGPSGSGKSTLLAIAGGLLRPDAGTVRVGGVELASAPERARSRLRAGKIGFVFQGANVAPFLNVGAMLALSARLAGRPRSEARRDVAQLLDAVGLADRGRALPGSSPAASGSGSRWRRRSRRRPRCCWPTSRPPRWTPSEVARR